MATEGEQWKETCRPRLVRRRKVTTGRGAGVGEGCGVGSLERPLTLFINEERLPASMETPRMAPLSVRTSQPFSVHRSQPRPRVRGTFRARFSPDDLLGRRGRFRGSWVPAAHLALGLAPSAHSRPPISTPFRPVFPARHSDPRSHS